MSFESNLGRLANNIITRVPETPKGLSRGFSGGKPYYSKSGVLGARYDRKDWPELMALQERDRTSPYHVHKDFDVPVLNQRKTNYCWCFGLVAGVMNRYAKMDGVAPLLSPAGPACQGKDFANEGGWGVEAVRYCNRYGIPTQDAWPNCSFNRELPDNPEVIESSKLHDVVEYERLDSYDFDGAMSALLDPLNSSPVTLGLSWWGHLVLGLQGIRYGGQWGIVIVNSWDYTWGEGGYGVLLGDRANPTEALVIKSIKPRRVK